MFPNHADGEELGWLRGRGLERAISIIPEHVRAASRWKRKLGGCIERLVSMARYVLGRGTG